MRNSINASHDQRSAEDGGSRAVLVTPQLPSLLSARLQCLHPGKRTFKLDNVSGPFSTHVIRKRQQTGMEENYTLGF